MHVKLPFRFKPANKKKLTLGIVSVMLVLLIGGFLLAVNPLFRQHALCLSCATTNPDIYVTNTSAKPNISYTLDASTGKIKNTNKSGNIDTLYYQNIINGINYELGGNTKDSPSSESILSATRISDGSMLWSHVLDSSTNSVIMTSTMLYVYNDLSNDLYSGYGEAQLPEVLAIDIKTGLRAWATDITGSVTSINLDNNTLFVLANNNLTALQADNGATLWNYKFVDTNGSFPSPSLITGDDQVFVGYSDEKISKVFAFDKNTGILRWQEKMKAGEFVGSLHIENHCLLIETTNHTLYVLNDSDKSLIWSYTSQSLLDASYQSQSDESWTYTNDIVYHLSSTTYDPQTFAAYHVLKAWHIADGKNIFQTKLEVDGPLDAALINDQLIFTSKNFPGLPKRHDDVVAIQAQTGTLLWHTQVGEIPKTVDDGISLWNISVVDNTQLFLCSTPHCNIRYYQVDNSSQNQSILYIALHYDVMDTDRIYAVNMHNGHVLWQVNPYTLTTNQNSRVITEFSLPTLYGQPGAITTGPDGNLWFTDDFANRIGRITPAGKITEFSVGLGRAWFGGITTGPDGNLWFTENLEGGQSQIGYITPSGKVTGFPLPSSLCNNICMPGGITAGPDGNLWFTESSGEQIDRITPDGQITAFPLPRSSDPGVITTGPDGNLWFTENVSDQIGRITPTGKITEFPLQAPSIDNPSTPGAITTGPDGNLWFTENVSNQIGRITPTGKITEFPLPPSNNSSDLEEITTGPDGNLWFIEKGGNQIVRITPTGQITAFAIPTPNSKPSGITAGPDGNLWFTEYAGNQIGRIQLGKSSGR